MMLIYKKIDSFSLLMLDVLIKTYKGNDCIYLQSAQ